MDNWIGITACLEELAPFLCFFREIRGVCRKLLLDEADKKVGITRSHFGAHSDSVNLFVIVSRERKAVKCENEFSGANKRFGARLLNC